MYNIIKSDLKCPECQSDKQEWQSKYVTVEGELMDNVLEEIPLTQAVNGEMHTFCDECHCYVEAIIEKGQVRVANVRKRN